MATNGLRLDSAETRLSAEERGEEYAGALDRIRRGVNGEPYRAPDGPD
jgi:hypothetical protein